MSNAPHPNETEAGMRAMRIDPDHATNGWEGPNKAKGVRVSREEMLWPGRIMSGGQTNAPNPLTMSCA